MIQTKLNIEHHYYIISFIEDLFINIISDTKLMSTHTHV